MLANGNSMLRKIIYRLKELLKAHNEIVYLEQTNLRRLNPQLCYQTNLRRLNPQLC